MLPPQLTLAKVAGSSCADYFHCYAAWRNWIGQKSMALRMDFYLGSSLTVWIWTKPSLSMVTANALTATTTEQQRAWEADSCLGGQESTSVLVWVSCSGYSLEEVLLAPMFCRHFLHRDEVAAVRRQDVVITGSRRQWGLPVSEIKHHITWVSMDYNSAVQNLTLKKGQKEGK